MTTTGSNTVRRAVDGDAERIGTLHLASWRATYAGELSPAFLERQDPSKWTARWQRHIANGVDVRVAQHGDALTGFVSFGRDRGTGGDDVWEIYALHVAPDSHSHGIGRTLFNAAAAVGRERGARRLVLWVVTTNANARAFYEHLGMRLDGGEQVHSVGGESLDEVRYALAF